MPPNDLTICALMRLRAAQSDSLAFVTHDRSIAYGDLDTQSAEIAARLVSAGVSKGNRVGLLMENGIEWALLAVAVMRIGAVLVPLSTFLQLGELRDQLRAAAVQHIIITGEFNGRDYHRDMARIAPTLRVDGNAPGCAADLPSLRMIHAASSLLDGRPATLLAAQTVQALEASVTPADDMVVMFTSGSSGTPKGCIHTHGSAICGVMTSLNDRRVRSDDRLYLPMPFFWTGGFGMGLMTALITGCTLLTETKPEPGQTLEFIARHGVTLFRGWPDQAAGIVQHPAFARTDLGNLRPASLAALLPESMRPQTAEARASLLGMTETFGPYCCYPLDRELPPEKWGSSGLVQPVTDVRIVDPETGARLAAGESGRIMVKGRNIMRGICGREAHDVFDADGYYDTGDLGRVDADGYMFYEGRADDMFKAKGATVFPGEVERALHDLPGVARAFVTDVPLGDSELAVAAAIVPQQGCELNEGELARQLKDRLSAFKRPTRWKIFAAMEDVPMLSSGKVDKKALREALAFTVQ